MQTTSVDVIRTALDRSKLAAAGGYFVLRLLSEAALQALANEAFQQHEHAETARTNDATARDGTEGNPNRWLESASGGPALNAFYHAAGVCRVLHEISGVQWQPSGGSATYSYYRGQGHHLGLHRDIDECDLAIITCIYDVRETDSASGGLVIYPSRQKESLEHIEQSPERGAVELALRPGESLVLLGGLVPHRLNVLAEGHVRIVAPLCYRAAGVSPAAAAI